MNKTVHGSLSIFSAHANLYKRKKADLIALPFAVVYVNVRFESPRYCLFINDLISNNLIVNFRYFADNLVIFT